MVRELCEFITKQTGKNCTKKLCKILGVERSSYYYCTAERPEGRIHAENAKLKKQVIRIYNKNDGVYGAPKIRRELLKLGLGFPISIRRVGKIMKSVGLRSVVIKKYRPQKSGNVYEGGENLLKWDFTTTNIKQKWVSYITYIHTLRDGWCHLASVMDLATNKIIGWHFSRNMDTKLVLTALNYAVKTQPGYFPQLVYYKSKSNTRLRGVMVYLNKFIHV